MAKWWQGQGQNGRRHGGKLNQWWQAVTSEAAWLGGSWQSAGGGISDTRRK